MRLASLLFSLLLSLTAFGQPSPINRRAFAITGLVKPSGPPLFLAYYWVASDMSNNIIVSNWVDRIQGSVWTNLNITTQPDITNSSSGVHFTRSKAQTLTNNVNPIRYGGTGGDSYVSQWIILQREASGVFQDFLDYADSGDAEWGYDPGNNLFLFLNTHSLNTGAVTPGTIQDVAVASDGITPLTIIYTNGVPCLTNTLAGRAFSDAFPWKIMGGISGSGFFGGYIRELLIYTNTFWTSQQVSNLHYYSTNTYGYTP